jgi:hypothetical protein
MNNNLATRAFALRLTKSSVGPQKKERFLPNKTKYSDFIERKTYLSIMA